ncbi:MAG: alkane 1-monooxygenase, partial [Leclercia adecarboxylata]|nr:alkane 1-monooxygenase [Leclercia adecarboxylata]
RIARRAQSLLVGTAESVRGQLEALHQQWGIDEFILDTPVADRAARVQSLRLLAQARESREVAV